MHDLEKLRDIVIRRGFMELIAEDIQVEFQKLEDALFEYGSLTEEGYYIELDETLQEAPEEVLVGGLAHELSHILTDRLLEKRLRFRDWLAYRISRRYKTLDERNTDLQIILRGFSRELLIFLEYAGEKGFPHYKEDGLSLREVKTLLEGKRP